MISLTHRRESPPSELLTPAQAAAILAVSPASVRRWVADGNLPALRLGDGPHARIRIRPESLAEFVREVAA